MKFLKSFSLVVSFIFLCFIFSFHPKIEASSATYTLNDIPCGHSGTAGSTTMLCDANITIDNDSLSYGDPISVKWNSVYTGPVGTPDVIKFDGQEQLYNSNCLENNCLRAWTSSINAPEEDGCYFMNVYSKWSDAGYGLYDFNFSIPYTVGEGCPSNTGSGGVSSPVVDVLANPVNISSGEGSIISYSSAHASSCQIEKDNVIVAEHCRLYGSYGTGVLNTGSYTYRVTCGYGGTWVTSSFNDCGGFNNVSYNNKNEKQIAGSSFKEKIKNFFTNLIPKILADVTNPTASDSVTITVNPAPTITLDLKLNNKKDLVDADNNNTEGTTHFMATLKYFPSGVQCLLKNTTTGSTSSNPYTTSGSNPEYFYPDGKDLNPGANSFIFNCNNNKISNTAEVSGQSGTLEAPGGTSCQIPAGQNSCDIPLTWTTTNPASSFTTKLYKNGELTSLSGNDSGGTVSVVYGTNPIYLTRNKVDGEGLNNNENTYNQLATLPLSADCVSGTHWNSTSSICELDVNPKPDLVAADPTMIGGVWAGQSKTFSSVISNSGEESTGTTSFYNLFQLGEDSSIPNGNGGISKSENENKIISFLKNILGKTENASADTSQQYYSVIGNFVSNATMSGLEVGASDTASASVAFPSTAGTYYVRACADKNSQGSTGVILESDEGNNCSDWVKIVTIAPASIKPNLIAYTPSLSAGSMGTQPTTLYVAPNKSIKFYSVISNEGLTTTGKSFYNSFQTRASSTSTPVSYTADPNPMPTLTNGATANATKSITSPASGSFEIRACADIPPANPGTVGELNEDDNCSAWVTVVVLTSTTAPDLTASAITPTSAYVNVATTLNSTVTNIGNATAISTNGRGFYNLMQWYDTADGVIKNVTSTNMIATPFGAGESALVSRSITFPSQGTYMARVCADKSSINDVTGLVTNESNENNNCGPWTKIIVGDVKPSGQITATDCQILEGGNKCNTKLTWTTANPQSGLTSQVTTPDNITVATANSGTATYPVEYGQRDFYLYHVSLLDQATATASCISGTIWNLDKGICMKSTDPIDGGWSNWVCDSCSQPCGGGTQSCTRSCTNPAPANGGKDCEGPSTTTQQCNTQSCACDNGAMPPLCTTCPDGNPVPTSGQCPDTNVEVCPNGAMPPLCTECPDGTIVAPGEQCPGGTGNNSNTVTLKAVPSWIFRGKSSILTWYSWGGATCDIKPAILSGAGSSGSVTVYPASTTTYTAFCTDTNGGTGLDDATVKVIKPIIFEN